ncbi:MAG: hypothetical protein HKN91_14860, partial [Acidimicrobiia bacterium]|nr:hypothetical protein [Acidimicrobiia bacterium]
MEHNQPKPPWRRHGHLLIGVTIVVASLFAVTALQLRATSSRTATQGAMSLALDAVDSLQAGEAAEISAALHQKMLAAVES